MAKHVPQSALRYPLTAILGSVAAIRTLRELVRHGGALSAPSLVARTGLAKASVRQALLSLEAMKIVAPLGTQRSRLFIVQREHPLAAALDGLFRAEEQRFDEILGAIRDVVGEHAAILAVWLYGSVARGTDTPKSELDIAMVCKEQSAPTIEAAIRVALQEHESRLSFRASIVAVDVDQLARLAAEKDTWWRSVAAQSLVLTGDTPDALISRLKRSQAS